jgi:hypothetical protein
VVDSDSEKSGGETEGSDYQDSDVEEEKKGPKKRKLAGGKPKVKEETPKRTQKVPIIDVEAILRSGGKNSVTTKTIERMTPDEKNEMIGTAGKSLLTQAKKGIRVQAMTVSCLCRNASRHFCDSFLSPYTEKIFKRCERGATQTSSCDEGACP